MNRFVFGAILGATAMYLLDPHRGARRRAMVMRGIAELDDLKGAAIGQARRLRNRARAGQGPDEEAMHPDDDLVYGRVLGVASTAMTNPSELSITVREGVVTLRGPVYAHEVDDLILGVEKLRGVTRVDDRLEVRGEDEEAMGFESPESLFL